MFQQQEYSYFLRIECYCIAEHFLLRNNDFNVQIFNTTRSGQHSVLARTYGSEMKSEFQPSAGVAHSRKGDVPNFRSVWLDETTEIQAIRKKHEERLAITFVTQNITSQLFLVLWKKTLAPVNYMLRLISSFQSLLIHLFTFYHNKFINSKRFKCLAMVIGLSGV